MSKVKILYVEDNKKWQQTIREVASMLEYQLDLAATSGDAMAKLKHSTYHVALLDKRLDEDDPENDAGLALAEVIAGLNEGTKIIVYTAHGTLEDMRAAFRKTEVWDFIPKETTPILEVKEIIEEAAKAARLEFMRPARMVDMLSSGGDALERLLSKFPEKSVHGITANDLERFARRLLVEFRPLFPHRHEPRLVTINQNEILEIRYWSKMLARPIVAMLAKANEMKTALERIDAESELRHSLGIQGKISELFDPASFPALGGAVFELINVDLEEFKAEINFTS